MLKSLNPIVRTGRPIQELVRADRSVVSEELPSLPPTVAPIESSRHVIDLESPSDSNTAPRRRVVDLGEAWPFPGTQNASEASNGSGPAPIPVSTFPPLTPLAPPPGSVPRLQVLVQAEPAQAVTNNVDPVEAPEAVPALEVIRRGASAPVMEIPHLEPVARPQQVYVVVRGTPDHDYVDLVGILSEETMRAIEGTTLIEKAVSFIRAGIATSDDAELYRRIICGQSKYVVIPPVAGASNTNGLVATVEIFDCNEENPRDSEFLLYRFVIFKIQSSSSGLNIKLVDLVL